MLLNNDAFVQEKCIESMMEIIESDEKIGVVGAIEYTLDGIPTKGDKPFIFFKPKVLLDPELKSLEELGYKDMPKFVDVDIVGSACSIVRKDALKGEPIFDERYQLAHYDQEDAWMRIKYINGYKIVMPTYGVFFKHIIAGTTSQNLELYNKVLQINKQKFLDKWLNEVK
jgi:GT2 family glycosyltransferase